MSNAKWKLVPAMHEGRAGLTDAMMRAFYTEFDRNSRRGDFERLSAGYNAMLEAAPPAPSAPAVDARSAFQSLQEALLADQSYAWSWHCNLAMPIMDSIHCTPAQANKAGADLMQYLFGIDVRKFKEWHHDEPKPTVDALTTGAVEKLIDEWYFHADEHVKEKLVRFAKVVIDAHTAKLTSDQRKAIEWAIGMASQHNIHKSPLRTLLAHPASEPKAAEDEPLTCDFYGAQSNDPWHTSDETRRHLHMCDACHGEGCQARAAEPCLNDEGLVPRPDLEIDPLWQWRCIANEAEIVVNHKGKFLMLSEEMCIRLGAALEESAAHPAPSPKAPAPSVEQPLTDPEMNTLVINKARDVGLRVIIDSKMLNDNYTNVTGSFPSLVRFARALLQSAHTAGGQS